MDDIFTYSVEDFLPFGREAFILLLSNYHAEFWPFNLGFVLLSIVAIAVTVWKTHYAARILTIPWLWIGLTYYRDWYGQLNWAADYFVGACVVQALLLATSVRETQDVREWNLVFPIGVVVFTPLLSFLFLNHSWIEMIGFTPLPTSLFFLAWLTSVKPLRWWLAIIPTGIVLVELVTHTVIT